MRQEALEVIRAQSVFAGEMELRMAVMECMREGKLMQVSSAMGYQAVQQLAATTKDLFSEITYCQEGYSPNAAYCSNHNFHYGGILGCHLCSGFFEK